MFESAELGRSVSPRAFKRRSTVLREELLRLQSEVLLAARRQVVLTLAGVDGGGKSESITLLNEWMDARWLTTNAYEPPNEVESRLPQFWRYWRDLPPRGRIGVFMSAWYSEPLLDRVYDRITRAEYERHLERVIRFEQALADDGAVIVKLWMHLSHDAQERRLRNLEQDPLTEARVTERDWANWRSYDRFIEVAEQTISRTHTGDAPWVIVEGTDRNYRSLAVAEAVRDALVRALRPVPMHAGGKPASGGRKKTRPRGRKSGSAEPGALTVLSGLDMSTRLGKEDYEMQLPLLQAELHHLHLRAKDRNIASVLVFEGPDGAGKGGAIRRVCTALSPRYYQVHGVAKPTEDEAAQHYLWRFWRKVPRDGRIAIFDRSWYGRVLVERVEGFAQEDEWRRAYAEINDFEQQLVEHGIVVLKFWLHITKEEQFQRFKHREKTPHKRWKLTEEDWRNRKKWSEYERAVNDMVQYTSTPAARWTLVEGNDKRYSRIAVLRHYCERLAAAIENSATPRPDGTGPEPARTTTAATVARARGTRRPK
jgi:polyphosphate:AMP phosphotransferase